MKIKTDENGRVLGFVTMGGMEGAEEYTGEIPAGFEQNCRTFRMVDGHLVKDEEAEAAMAKAKAEAEELSEISSWFSWYDNQIAQYSRAVRLGETFDKDIAALDAEAAQKQARIREIKNGG